MTEASLNVIHSVTIINCVWDIFRFGFRHLGGFLSVEKARGWSLEVGV